MSKNNVKVYISRREIGLYQQEKIRKDVVFFQRVIPYVRVAVISTLIFGMLIHYYNLNVSNLGKNYTKLFFLRLLDLEENNSYKEN